MNSNIEKCLNITKKNNNVKQNGFYSILNIQIDFKYKAIFTNIPRQQYRIVLQFFFMSADLCQ